MRSFIITGPSAQRDEFLKDFIEKESVPSHSIIEYKEEIKIKQARAIRLDLSKKHSSKKLIIISSKINVASQNTLLKSFEELSELVSIVISVDNSNDILDTIKSRLFLVNLQDDHLSDDSNVENFISDDISQRLLIIDKFLNENSSDAKKQADEFILLYRRSLMERLEGLNSQSLNQHIKILKRLLEVSDLVKHNNLNLRLGLESAIL